MLLMNVLFIPIVLWLSHAILVQLVKSNMVDQNYIYSVYIHLYVGPSLD
jgi:hypothetical protein